MVLRSILLVAALATLVSAASAQEQPLIPPGEKEPLLRLEAGGPTSFVTALAFGPDGKSLYAAGWDKVVRVWNLDARTGRFVLDAAAFRVPIGPGSFGMLNALAVSPDGAWLATGGMGLIREGSGFRKAGFVLPRRAAMSTAMREDEGMIYVFDTQTRAVRVLRGHQGPVLTLAFAPRQDGKPPLLVSAAQEWDGKQLIGSLRLWDVAAGKQVARTPQPLPNPGGIAPGLALRHTGAGPRQAQVSIAWMDGTFRVWDVAQDELAAVPAEGRNNRTAAYLGDPRLVLTGQTGRLRVWNVTPGRPPRPEKEWEVSLTPAGATPHLPWAMAAFSSRGAAAPDLAAVAVYRDDQKDQRLRVLEIDQGFGTVRADVPLWTGRDIPVLAAAPDGRHLAAAGNRDNTILVYPVQGLLANRAQPQVLQSAGTMIRAVAFARKGQDLGLAVNEQPWTAPPAPGAALQRDDLVFDFGRRVLSSDQAGWQIAGPALAGWGVQRATAGQGAEAREVLTVSRDGRQVGQVRLLPGQGIAQVALLPTGPFRVPLLAVAFNEGNVPFLFLYNVETGERVWQLNGHTNTIHSLAFAPDGKFLASAAEDQTVCLWSLTTFASELGQTGQLNGVGIRQEKQGPLVISSLDTEALLPANQGKLREGDVIEGVVEGGKLRAVPSVHDLLRLEVVPRQPGQSLSLRVRDAQGNRRDVALVLGQGVSDQKPLFSLFITRAGAAAVPRQWLGWSPLGYYDASEQQAERNLGLHFNTGRPEEPTRFAYTDQYRKDHFREDLLRYLVARGSLSPALEDWKKDKERKPLPRPNMSLWLEELGPSPKDRDERGRVVVRQTQLTLRLGIDNFPLDHVDAVTWQVHGGAAQTFQPSPLDQNWSADLSQVPWRRGEIRLRAVLRTLEEKPQTFTEELVLRYQPKAPVLSTTLPRFSRVDKAAFTLEALVRPGTPGQDVAVTVRHEHQGQAVATRKLTLGQRAELPLREVLTLKEGENLLEVTAVNEGALAGYEDLETEQLVFVVAYTPPKVVDPPRIQLVQVTPLDDVAAGPGQEPVRGRAVVVDVPRVRLTGKIQGFDLLTEATRALGDAAAVPLAGFQPQRDKVFAIDETLELKPGSQRVQLRARSATSKETVFYQDFEYRPRLPVLELAPLEETVFYEGEQRPELTLKGTLTYPRARQPFEVVVVVNDQASPVPVADGATTLEVKVALAPGESRVQLRLSNRWGARQASEELLVRYLRPPRVVKIEGPARSEKPTAEVTVRVDSALPLAEGEPLEVSVNGRRQPLRHEVVRPAKPEERSWSVRLADLTLREGENTLRVWATNADGRSRQPAEFAITFTPPRPPVPPVVTFREPHADRSVQDRALTVRFEVRSEKPLVEVYLERTGRGRELKPFRVDELRPGRPGIYEIEARVTLDPKENILRAVAKNSDDSAEASITVNYLHMPVRLVFDRVETMGPRRELARQDLGEGRVTFAEAPEGRIWLHGRVIWDREEDEQLRGLARVETYVNDVRQLPAELQPPEAKRRERAFRAPLFLNRSSNRIEVRLPELKREASSRHEFPLLCTNPDAGQRLHLVIVGVGEKDEKRLMQRILTGLGAQATGERQFKTPAFEIGQIYGPLTGRYIPPRDIYDQLNRIRHSIRHLKESDMRSGGQGRTDVVVIYFQGGEAMGSGRYSLVTSQSATEGRALERSAVSFPDLANRLADTPGVQMVLLDTNRLGVSPLPGGQERLDAYVPDEKHVAVLRTSWQKAGQPPEDARLLSAWEKGIVKAGNLGNFTAFFNAHYSQLSQRYQADLDYDLHVSSGLDYLMLGPSGR